MTAEKFFTHPLGIIGSATAATFLWGTAFPFIKLSYAELQIGGSDTFGQMLFAGYRFVLAGLLIFAFMALMKQPVKYVRGTWKGLSKLALFQTFLQYVFLYIGISMSTGIQGSIIAGATSFFQILIAHFMYKNDAMTLRKVLGIILGFLGILSVGLTEEGFNLQFGFGEILLLAAMFFGGLGNVVAKNEAKDMNILYMTSWQMLIGGLALIVVGATVAGLTPFVFTLKAAWMLLYLAFLSAGGFVLWNNVMKFNKVGSVSMYLFLIPVFGVFLAAVMLGEPVHMIILLSLALVVAGIIIVNRQPAIKESNA
ncbi:transporter [Paenibacillus swuensis]|uniref:Transporter n=1 Tax=Paenibacillus swuensis TaxID=1178515 RepID=A0A172TGQ1_9BACL|nr:DMT family transporter [Paenibacillus swuensis]ANE46142.1 transporter [Paenibacillus swuensis]